VIAAAHGTATAALTLPRGDLWVFGYGSLMWKPGFPHAEVRAARIHGYHRALCVWSWVYRGTQANPGLVVGLDTGGSCVGRAFRVVPAHKGATVQYLYQREMVTRVYVPVLAPVRLDNGRQVKALTFIVDRTHAQYAGKLGAEQAAVTIRRARGKGGANTDYIANTVAHLDELGIADSLLHEIHALLNAAQ
jgi:cation transport protein ChaC